METATPASSFAVSRNHRGKGQTISVRMDPISRS